MVAADRPAAPGVRHAGRGPRRADRRARHRRWRLVPALAATLGLAAALGLAGCGPGRPAQPRTAPPRIHSALLRSAMQGLCAAENAQEMGVTRLGQLYDAGPGRYLVVARAESAARRGLAQAMSALAATGTDRSALGTLVDDQDAVLTARERLLGLIDDQPANGRLALMTGPPGIVRAYRDVVDAYLAAGGDFLVAGLPSCATPMITVLVGPGQDEASAATVEFRIAAACHTVGYTTHAERPASSTRYVAALGTVAQPGTHRPGDRYDGSSGAVSPAVAANEVVVLTSVHYPVESATCVADGPAPPEPS